MIDDDEQEEQSTFLQPRFDITALPEEPFVLTISGGPDIGARWELDGTQPTRTLAGQSPACEIRLNDRSVSRRHAAFEVIGPRLRVTDLDSRNGTFVNETSVVEAYLQGGELLALGDTTLRVSRGSPKAEPSLPNAVCFGRLVGASTEMRRLYPLCERLAQSTIPLVIEGETGTGKEVLAEAIHEQGLRASGPFVVFDCTAVPPNLVESELFGHEKGAFTGAIKARKGMFEQAHGGTLLLDEIGDLDIALQSKLLRAIERAQIRPVGSNTFINVDVRVLAATRRDLDREVHAGRFRDDLFHPAFRMDTCATT